MTRKKTSSESSPSSQYLSDGNRISRTASSPRAGSWSIIKGRAAVRLANRAKRLHKES